VEGFTTVSLMSRDGRFWLNQKQVAGLFAVSKPNISMLGSKIFAEKELDGSVVKQYLTTDPAHPRTLSPFSMSAKGGFPWLSMFLSDARRDAAPPCKPKAGGGGRPAGEIWAGILPPSVRLVGLDS
jgi:hypothetical protein